jgi:hypothetical protein
MPTLAVLPTAPLRLAARFAARHTALWTLMPTISLILTVVSPMILTVVVYTIVDSFLRSDLSFYLKSLNENYKYGLHAAVSWCYILLSLLILGIALIFLKKVVFYHDERK